MDISRRKLIVATASALICAPAIVRISSLMPVKAWDQAPQWNNPFYVIAASDRQAAMIQQLKDTGIWEHLDSFWYFDAPTKEQALFNWKAPSVQLSSHD